MKIRLKKEWNEFVTLMRSIPSFVVVVFVVSVVAMNLLANKSIDTGTEYLALDCGIIVSWLSFLSMDIITKHFGPKAATQISFVAVACNLVLCLVFFIVKVIPGVWGESFVDGSEEIINGALNNTFGGTWYILLGSTVAFCASAIINNTMNFAVGKLFKKNPDGMGAYIIRSYVSTAVGQFADNLIFALIVSKVFFGWSWLQCFTCALTGMLIELACEALFAHFGFFVCKKWKEMCIGKEYFAIVRKSTDDKPDECIE